MKSAVYADSSLFVFYLDSWYFLFFYYLCACIRVKIVCYGYQLKKNNVRHCLGTVDCLGVLLLRRPSAQVVDESEYDGSYIGQERKTFSDTDTEDTYQREEVKDPEWDFVAFNKDSLQKLLNNEIYKKVYDLNEFFIKEDGYLYPMSIYAKGDTLSRKQPTLYHLQRYISRDNNKLLAFWARRFDEGNTAAVLTILRSMQEQWTVVREQRVVIRN